MQGPSAELRETLRKTFGIKKPDRPKEPALLPVHDVPGKIKPKSVGNVMLSAAAQQIYNPAQPSTPIKPSTTAQAGQGTAPAMNTQGPWGQPEKE